MLTDSVLTYTVLKSIYKKSTPSVPRIFGDSFIVLKPAFMLSHPGLNTMKPSPKILGTLELILSKCALVADSVLTYPELNNNIT